MELYIYIRLAVIEIVTGLCFVGLFLDHHYGDKIFALGLASWFLHDGISWMQEIIMMLCVWKQWKNADYLDELEEGDNTDDT